MGNETVKAENKQGTRKSDAGLTGGIRRRRIGGSAGPVSRIGNEAVIDTLSMLNIVPRFEELDENDVEEQIGSDQVNDTLIQEEGEIAGGNRDSDISVQPVKGPEEESGLIREEKPGPEEEKEVEIILEDKDPDSALDELDRIHSDVTKVNDQKSAISKGGGDIEATDTSEQIEKEKERINKSMDRVKGWNFVPIPKKRQKASGWRRFWTRATSVFTSITKAVVNVVTLGVSVFKRKMSLNRIEKAEKTMQHERNYNVIPGWDGAEFEKNQAEGKEDFLGDVRRVPLVWSYPIAGEADTGEGENKKLKEPEVTIYIDQPKSGSVEHMSGTEMGHSMIGIEYSRYSNVTKRNERYAIKYGFYPAGGYQKVSSTIMMANYGVTIPGELTDDRYHAFSVSRRYPSNMENISRIIKESEKYANKGYNYYSRNCATFVREMAVAGNIPSAKDDSVFKEHEVNISPLDNILRWGAGAGSSFYKSNMLNLLSKYSQSDDLSYQNFGSKRVTRQDTATYLNSLNGEKSNKRGFIPSEIGEALRFQKGAGAISSYKYAGSLGKDIMKVRASADIFTLKNELRNEAVKLYNVLEKVVTEEQLNTAPVSVRMFIGNLTSTGSATLGTLVSSYAQKREGEEDKEKDEYKPLFEVVTADEIRRTRQELQRELDDLGNVYEEPFGSDSRLQTPFMNMISLMQLSINVLDSQYERRMVIESSSGELGNIAETMLMKKLDIDFRDEKGELQRVEITPSTFEAYLQVFKDPLTAVKKAHRYNSIVAKDEKKWTSADKKDYAELKKYKDLLIDFDRSHMYMLERQNFSQQDISYAMKLQKREQPKELSGDMFSTESGPGTIYAVMILDKIFGGMRDTYLKEEADGGITDEALGKMSNVPPDYSGFVSWLKTYIKGCIERNPDMFRMIMKGLANAKNEGENDDAVIDQLQLIMLSYVKRVFIDNGEEKEKLTVGNRNIESAWIDLSSMDKEFVNYLKERIPHEQNI